MYVQSNKNQFSLMYREMHSTTKLFHRKIDSLTSGLFIVFDFTIDLA